jgi:enoyl-CoA hydratase
VRVVVYAGAGGKAFASGADISEFASKRDSAEANLEYSRITARGREKDARRSRSRASPASRAIAWAAASTSPCRRTCGWPPATVFGIPAARMGIAYGIEPMERLVSLVGPARARLMLYTARRFNAEEACAMGLVEVLAARTWSPKRCNSPRRSRRTPRCRSRPARFAIEQVLKPGERDAAGMAEHTRRCMESADYREGRTAFTAKRKPVFTGS